MKQIKIPLRNSTLFFIFSFSVFRKYRWVKLPFFGSKTKVKFEKQLDGRLITMVKVKWRWFPFCEYLRLKDVRTDFKYYSNDPFPLKCYLEYELWKYKYESFSSSKFVSYMCDKFKMSEDDVLEGCHSAMLSLSGKSNLYEKDRQSPEKIQKA
jgi:hypothetical protein